MLKKPKNKTVVNKSDEGLCTTLGVQKRVELCTKYTAAARNNQYFAGVLLTKKKRTVVKYSDKGLCTKLGVWLAGSYMYWERFSNIAQQFGKTLETFAIIWKTS